MIPVQSCQDDGFSTGFLGSFVVACSVLMDSRLIYGKIVTSWATNQNPRIIQTWKNGGFQFSWQILLVPLIPVYFRTNMVYVPTLTPPIWPPPKWIPKIRWVFLLQLLGRSNPWGGGETTTTQYSYTKKWSKFQIDARHDSTVPARHVDLRDPLRSVEGFFVDDLICGTTRSLWEFVWLGKYADLTEMFWITMFSGKNEA